MWKRRKYFWAKLWSPLLKIAFTDTTGQPVAWYVADLDAKNAEPLVAFVFIIPDMKISTRFPLDIFVFPDLGGAGTRMAHFCLSARIPPSPTDHLTDTFGWWTFRCSAGMCYRVQMKVTPAKKENPLTGTGEMAGDIIARAQADRNGISNRRRDRRMATSGGENR
jgi:hypothetical protein